MTRRRVLTKEQRAAVRAEYQNYSHMRSYARLGVKYGVGASTIRDIVKYWVS